MVSRIGFWWRLTHSIYQVRVIAGELVGNGFLADENFVNMLFQGLKLTDDFGFAPSTLVYQGELSPSSKWIIADYLPDREAPLGKGRL